ncbi:hypothetical protein GobsT_14220 [Gemmata obscuriglobus]|uniref:Uncharacterized protein n=1 Tax=Gemmata obscuriglobus TaxID=114 RepID=A0A2Z3H9C5_9BACT|nr:hypothetical protein [Gemmata obscuriglobus]AWM40147.1 hypothetical protein C1280_26170 [Gemmata obscuriglobus]QEG26677.1 hypothetical protein GobsT_14220 [Gemmata obscuriglobus]VTS02320.1 unnamed protein product [Gemmata obscuriglobus UQM 2246]
MDPVKVNVGDFETSEKALKIFFRNNAKKFPDGVSLNIDHRQSDGAIEVTLWSYKSEQSHVAEAKEQLQKDFKLSFGPLQKTGRGSTYYFTEQKVSADEFIAFLKRVDPKIDSKLIDSFKRDYDALEAERKKKPPQVPTDVLGSVTIGLRDKFEAAAVALDTLSGGAAYGNEAHTLFFQALAQVRSGARPEAVVRTLKSAITALDAEASEGTGTGPASKVRMHLVGLQGVLAETLKTPVEATVSAGAPAVGRQSQRTSLSI